eukprot:TRINITY_DN4568_c0_g1_i2.p1 TRINITY_DN4568_c0_g1~~TRINITY_DN4568_c0_g1_i2.p1  ORF type:complete len:428 (-),score=94.98 TRINITY_DN4568_c0_g1_i2:702-1985(-)
MIYARHSNLSAVSYDGPSYRVDPSARPSVADIAATLTVLLGVPPPTQSEGVIVQEALPLLTAEQQRYAFQQQWAQKKRYTSRFVTKVSGASAAKSDWLTREDIPARDGYQTEAAILFYTSEIAHLDSEFAAHTTHAMRARIVVNAAFCAALTVAITYAFVLLTWCFTCADPPSLFCRGQQGSLNRKAFFLALLLYMCYFATALPLYVVIDRFIMQRASGWQFTCSLINTQDYMMSHTVPLIVCISVVCILPLYIAIARVAKRQPCVFYLFRVYACLVSAFVLLLLRSLVCIDHVFMPGTLWVRFATVYSWNMLARAQTASLLAIVPVLFCTLALLACTDSAASQAALALHATRDRWGHVAMRQRVAAWLSKHTPRRAAAWLAKVAAVLDAALLGWTREGHSCAGTAATQEAAAVLLEDRVVVNKEAA